MLLGSRSGRTPVDTPVEISLGESLERLTARARELSIGTAVFDTDVPPPLGTDIRVYLQVPGHVEVHALPAKVRWTSDRMIGVQFGTMGAIATYQLTEMLWERRTSPPPPAVHESSPPLSGDGPQASGEWHVQRTDVASGEWQSGSMLGQEVRQPAAAADFWADFDKSVGE